MSGVIEHLSRLYVNKDFELSMYKQAISSKGNDAQLLLKASIKDMIALRTENAKLHEAVDGKKFEARYCTQQMVSTQSNDKHDAQSFGYNHGESQA